MTWLAPDAWIDACGAPADGLRAPYVPRSGDDALWPTLDADPRRLAFIVGTTGQGASRLALELARRAVRARLPDPARPPAPGQSVALLAGELAGVPDHQRPVVILDGPLRQEGFALARGLLHTPLHPRLLLLVPATAEQATRLLHLAGLSPASARVLVLTGPPPAAAVAPDPDPALLPYALAGRRALGRCGPELAELRRRRLVAADERSGTAVCLLPDRARRVLAGQRLALAASGPARLAALLAADPALGPAAAATLAPFLDTATPLAIEHVLFDRPSPDFVAALEAMREAGAQLPAPLLGRLAARARALLEAETDPDLAADLAGYVAGFLVADGDVDGAVACLRLAVVDRLSARRSARLRETLTDLVQQPEVYAAAAAACRDAGDRDGLIRILPGLARLRHIGGDVAGARACCAELEAIAGAGDDVPARLAAWGVALDLAADAGELPRAVDLATRVHAAHRSIGNYRGQVLALHRLAALARSAGDQAAAGRALHEALRLEQAADNPRGATVCQEALGSLAEAREDPEAALAHYRQALAGYRAQRLPSRALELTIERLSALRPSTAP